MDVVSTLKNLIQILQIGWHFTSLMRFLCEFGGKPVIRFCLKKGACEECESKITPLDCDSLESSQVQDSPNKKNLIASKENSSSTGDSNSEDVLNRKGDNEREVHAEDEVVMQLRKMVKIERKRANAAYAEVDKERNAAESAAEEAMAMILRLQNEKSSVEIQANQYRRMAEQKHEYDQEVIESLRWIVTKHEDQLRVYRQKLRQYMREHEIDSFEGVNSSWGFLDFSVEEVLDGPPAGSPEMDSQTL